MVMVVSSVRAALLYSRHLPCDCVIDVGLFQLFFHCRRLCHLFPLSLRRCCSMVVSLDDRSKTPLFAVRDHIACVNPTPVVYSTTLPLALRALTLINP